MHRRQVLGSLVAMTALPRAAQGQQLPVIGFLGSEAPELWRDRLEAFRQGLGETGFVEGQSVLVSYLWAGGQNDRLEGLAAELVRRRVAVIVVLGSTRSALAAKNATSEIPVVVRVAVDPIGAGLVSSLGRPGGNVTGWTTLGAQIGPKQLQLLREILPAGAVVGVLVNQTNPIIAAPLTRDVPAAAASFGFIPLVVEASTNAEIDAAFARLAAAKAAAVVIGADTFFNARNDRIVALALRNGMASVSAYREHAVAGGLMSYGGSVAEASRQVGIYVGRILKGERPADLPVQQVARLDLVINLKTAATLGITIPPSLMARTEEIIE